MTMNMKLKPLALLMLLVCFLQACQKSADQNTKGVPEKLIIGSYGGDNPGNTQAALEPFRLYLQEKLGMEVEYLFTTDYATVVQALRSKKIHMADLTPFAYVIATQKPGLIPLVTFGANGKPSLYNSIIF